MPGSIKYMTVNNCNMACSVISKPAALILIVLIFTSCSANVFSSASNFIMQPYLQGMTEYSVFIMVESVSKKPVFVDYSNEEGTTFTESTSYYRVTDKRNPLTYVHRIKLAGLEPGVNYRYKLRQGSSRAGEYSFRTIGRGEPLRIAVCSDNAKGSMVFADICKQLKSRSPQFVLHAGDVSYSSRYSTWKRDFFIRDFLDLATSVPFYVAIGNHEGWRPNTLAFLEAPPSASGEQHYYSFETGNTYILVLSSQHPAGQGSRQYAYAEQSLASTKKPWKIVMFHKSAYCGCPHGNLSDFRELADSVLAKYKADIVINGHSHHYQKNYVNGIYHFIMGGAGSGLHDPEPAVFSLESVQAHHYAIFEITGKRLGMKVYGLEGAIIDSLELEK